MAKSKDAWSRFRERDEERSQENKEKGPDIGLKGPKGVASQSSDDAVLDMIAKAEVMIEQVQNLYHMYISGLERLPPVTQRKLLEDLLQKIQSAPKPTASLNFRVSAFTAKLQTYREKWDKLMKDVESGKVSIKRKA